MPIGSKKPHWPFIGQEQLGEFLVSSLADQRLARALLFAGPRALGKGTAAVWLAKADCCQGPVRPCEVCPDCLMIARGQHPEVQVLDGTDQLGVEAIRAATSRYKFSIVERRRQWLIITDAESMSEPASNSVLKFIEELPNYVQLVLTSSQPESLLATIRSRMTTYYWRLVGSQSFRQAGTSRQDSTFALGRPGWIGEAVSREQERQSLEQFMVSGNQLMASKADQSKEAIIERLHQEEFFLREALLAAVQATTRRRWKELEVSASAQSGLRQRLEKYLQRYELSDNVQAKLLYDNLHLA